MSGNYSCYVMPNSLQAFRINIGHVRFGGCYSRNLCQNFGHSCSFGSALVELKLETCYTRTPGSAYLGFGVSDKWFSVYMENDFLTRMSFQISEIVAFRVYGQIFKDRTLGHISGTGCICLPFAELT